MKKVLMGLIALVLCFSSFKGMAQENPYNGLGLSVSHLLQHYIDLSNEGVTFKNFEEKNSDLMNYLNKNGQYSNEVNYSQISEAIAPTLTRSNEENFIEAKNQGNISNSLYTFLSQTSEYLEQINVQEEASLENVNNFLSQKENVLLTNPESLGMTQNDAETALRYVSIVKAGVPLILNNPANTHNNVQAAKGFWKWLVGVAAAVVSVGLTVGTMGTGGVIFSAVFCAGSGFYLGSFFDRR